MCYCWLNSVKLIKLMILRKRPCSSNRQNYYEYRRHHQEKQRNWSWKLPLSQWRTLEYESNQSLVCHFLFAQEKNSSNCWHMKKTTHNFMFVPVTSSQIFLNYTTYICIQLRKNNDNTRINFQLCRFEDYKCCISNLNRNSQDKDLKSALAQI